MTYREHKILERSININGPEIKHTVAMEECAELIQAISKALRGQLDRDNLVEEIADVGICIDMLRLIYKINTDEIDRCRSKKIERQQWRDDDLIAARKEDKNVNEND